MGKISDVNMPYYPIGEPLDSPAWEKWREESAQWALDHPRLEGHEESEHFDTCCSDCYCCH